jgi:hypothetical protein
MFKALQAASVTLKQVLDLSFAADPDLAALFAGGPVVSLETPDEMDAAGRVGLSLWLYRLVRDEQTLNRPPPRPAPNRIRRQPLPVRLHYLMTPIITSNAGGGAPETEQIILGRVLQTFNDHPLVSGADLQGPFEGTGVELALRLETLALDEITRIWDSLERPYQLCVSYEVGVAAIDSMREDQGGTPVAVAAPEYGIGAPEMVP